MSSAWLSWLLLSVLTGSPLTAAVLLLVLWLLVDRLALGVGPDPWRWWQRWRREAVLERGLAINPHDRRARLEWAELLSDRGAHGRAAEVLRPNLEAGDDDVNTLFVFGRALALSGVPAQGEQLLAIVLEREPKLRASEAWLVLGRSRMNRGELPGAIEALQAFLRERTGSVEGRVRLAEAFQRAGQVAQAQALRAEAWREFTHAPWFRRRQERWWAWRARPVVPLMGALLLLTALAVAALAWSATTTG